MDKVTIEYQTRKDYCHCCEQKLPNPVISATRTFNFTKDNFLESLEKENWKVEAECKEALLSLIKEFVYETIQFYAADSDDRILIEKNEFLKVKTFVLEKVIA